MLQVALSTYTALKAPSLVTLGRFMRTPRLVTDATVHQIGRVTSAAAIERGDRVLELDVLRGLAALAVVFFHYTVRYGELFGFSTPPAFRLPLGLYGVHFFFCISGFVIFMTLDHTATPLDFLVSRVSRLWPAYIVAITITFTAVHLFALPGRQTTLIQALINVTMIQNLLRVPHVDAVYWSLQVELIFYGWMLFAYVTGLLRHFRILASALLVPTLIYFVAIHFFAHEPSTLAGKLLLVEYAPYFVIGMAAYRIRSAQASRLENLLISLTAVVVAAIALPTIESILAGAACTIFLLAAVGWLRWIANAPLTFLGSISYSLYLLHQNIGYIVIRACIHFGAPTNAAILAALALSIALATALTWSIERPARKWLRDQYAHFRAARDRAEKARRVTAASQI